MAAENGNGPASLPAPSNLRAQLESVGPRMEPADFPGYPRLWLREMWADERVEWETVLADPERDVDRKRFTADFVGKHLCDEAGRLLYNLWTEDPAEYERELAALQRHIGGSVMNALYDKANALDRWAITTIAAEKAGLEAHPFDTSSNPSPTPTG